MIVVVDGGVVVCGVAVCGVVNGGAVFATRWTRGLEG
jgi:hypothetical protein